MREAFLTSLMVFARASLIFSALLGGIVLIALFCILLGNSLTPLLGLPVAKGIAFTAGVVFILAWVIAMASFIVDYANSRKRG